MLSPAWVGMAVQRAQQWPGGRPCFGSSFWLSGAFCLCVGHEILRQVLAVPCHSSVQGCTAPPLSPSVHPEGWPCPTSRRMCSLWGSPEIPLQRHEVRNWISCVSQQEKGFDNGLHLLGLLQGVDAVLCRAAPGDDGLLGAAGGCRFSEGSLPLTAAFSSHLGDAGHGEQGSNSSQTHSIPCVSQPRAVGNVAAAAGAWLRKCAQMELCSSSTGLAWTPGSPLHVCPAPLLGTPLSLPCLHPTRHSPDGATAFVLQSQTNPLSSSSCP